MAVDENNEATVDLLRNEGYKAPTVIHFGFWP